jgi:hypothetical protein
MIGIRAWKRPKCHDNRNVCRKLTLFRLTPAAIETAKASMARATAIAKILYDCKETLRMRRPVLQHPTVFESTPISQHVAYAKN